MTARIVTDVVVNLRSSVPSELRDRIDYSHDHNKRCLQRLDRRGDDGRWVCTREKTKVHDLHIALSTSGTLFCAKWYTNFVVDEDPDVDELI